MQRYDISIQQPWNTTATEHGDWVKAAEAKAEIARLQAEVERLSNLNRQRAEDMITMGEDTNKLCREYETRGFNAGIEAAVEAVAALNHGGKLVRSKESVTTRAVAAIRALKRPTGDTT